MPTPVGHSLAGLAIQFCGDGSEERRDWLLLAAVVFLANAPDLDFIPGYLVGQPRVYHWGPMHSVMAGVLIGGVVGSILGVRSGKYGRTIGLCVFAYLSHILLDTLLGPPEPFLGLQVLWPFTTRPFMMPWSVFMMAPATIDAGPVAALLSREILPVITRELLVMIPVTLASWAFARLRERRSRKGLELAVD